MDEEDDIDEILSNLGISDSSMNSSSNSGVEEQVENTSTDRLDKLHESGKITDKEYKILISIDSESDDNSTNENKFGTTPVSKEVENVEITVIGVFPEADVAPIGFDHRIEGEVLYRTVVLFEVYNKSSSKVKWGNNSLSYVLDNRLSIDPDREFMIGGLPTTWKKAPYYESVPEVEPDTKSRWISVVNPPEGEKIAEAILTSDDGSKMNISIPDSAYGSGDKVPF